MLLLFFILLTLALSALFSGSEIAFLSANKLEIELEKDKKSPRGKTLERFYKDPQRYLSSMLVGNNIALVIFTTLMTGLVNPWFGDGMSEVNVLIIVTLFITVIVLIFGEFLPKTYFRKHATKLMLALARPLSFINSFIAIPTWLMMSLSSMLLRLFFKNPMMEETVTLTRLDLENYIQDQVDDAEMFKNALNLKETRVREAMVPRTEIINIDVEDKIDHLIELINEHKLSRIIVTNDGIEDVIGYVHHQSLLEDKNSIRNILIDIPYVPESMSVMDLLKLFRKQGKSIACVVDEYGGTAGIITLEDIIEEIFGEIEDEHDSEDYIEQDLGNQTYRFSGRLEIDYLNEKYERLKIPEGDYETISGYIVMTVGHIPDEGEEIDLDDFHFTAEKVTETKLEVVKIKIKNRGL